MASIDIYNPSTEKFILLYCFNVKGRREGGGGGIFTHGVFGNKGILSVFSIQQVSRQSGRIREVQI